MSAANNVTVAFIKEISAWVDNAYDTNWTAILMKDISGDGGVHKMVVKKGVGDMPIAQEQVYFHYATYINGRVIHDSRKGGIPTVFITSTGMQNFWGILNEIANKIGVQRRTRSCRTNCK
jgi:hypothetical protein